MNDNKTQTQDAFIKKALLQVTPMSPDPDFLKNVMRKVETLPAYQPNPVVYSPLISKKGWFIIVLLVSGLLAATFFTLSPDTLPLPDFQKYLIISLDHFCILCSQVFTLGLVVLVGLFLVQMWLITRGNKKMA